MQPIFGFGTIIKGFEALTFKKIIVGTRYKTNANL